MPRAAGLNWIRFRLPATSSTPSELSETDWIGPPSNSAGRAILLTNRGVSGSEMLITASFWVESLSG